MQSVPEQRHLHFDFSFIAGDVPLKLHVGVKRMALQRHTPQTLALHRTLNCALGHIPDARLTHFVADVPLPSAHPQLLLVTAPPQVAGARLGTLLLAAVQIPLACRRQQVQRLVSEGHPNSRLPHPKFAHHGVNLTALADSAPIIDVHDYKSAFDTAVSLAFHHVEMINLGGATSASVTGAIEYANGASALAQQILEQAQAHMANPSQQNWAYEAPYLDSQMRPTDSKFYNWSDITKEWAVGLISDSLKKVKNDPALRSTASNAGVYTVQDGKVDAAQDGFHGALVQDGGGAYWTLNNLTPHHGLEQTAPITFADNTFSIAFTNNWLRWLSGYVEFYGPDGNPVEPAGWVSQMHLPQAKWYESATKKYVAIFSAVNTILAIPVGNTPTTISFAWPPNASSVRIMAGGIGRSGGIPGQDGKYVGGWDTQVCLPGAIMTGIFNFGIPTVCLLAGAYVATSAINRLAKGIFSLVLDVFTAIINGPVSSAIQGGNTWTLLSAFIDLIPRLLLDIAELTVFMEAEIAEGAAEEATPVFGWIALAVSVVTDVALLAQTSAEVAMSPATFTTTAVRAIDASWTLLPDAAHQDTWPAAATHYDVVATFKDGTTRSVSGALGTPQRGPLTVLFDAAAGQRLPAGGSVMFSAKLFSASGWLAGAAKTAFMSADVAGNLLTVPAMAISENLVPLNAGSVYQFDQALGCDGGGAHVWSGAGGAPDATVNSLSSSNVGHNLATLANITVSQQTSELGYCWQASEQQLPLRGRTEPFSGQMFTFQATGVAPAPKPRFVPAGMTAKPLVLFDLDGPASGIGNNFWIDPADSLYHVRALALDQAGQFDLGGQSWGRFNQQIDAAVVHPSGYVVGINSANSKLEVLRIGTRGGADAEAPLAEIYSGNGTRTGLLQIPVGVAATAKAGVIVLEAPDTGLAGAQGRLQAFDLLGNPAPIFAGASAVAPLRAEAGPVTLLDLALESLGYIYVLKYINSGALVSDYRLDIYQPDGAWLCQTAGVAAARMTVDLWRTLYTLNFAAIAKPGGGRTEPSVSRWLPSTPASAS